MARAAGEQQHEHELARTASIVHFDRFDFPSAAYLRAVIGDRLSRPPE
jgi:hypothetical protein